MAKRKLEESFSERNSVNVVSDILEEDYSFTWKIENFDVIKSSKDLINKQQFPFQAGEGHGYLTKWRCVLEQTPPLKTIGISLKLVKAPPRASPLVSYSFQSVMASGVISKVVTEERKTFTQGTGAVFKGFLSENGEQLKNLITADGSIVIKLTFKIFIAKQGVVKNKETNLEKLVKEFETKELGNLSKSMIGWMEGGGGGEPEIGKIIKVVAKNGQVFYANTAMLSVRSPVFKAMFDSLNWREGQGQGGQGSSGDRGGEGSGSNLVLKDLSGKTVKIMLHYLHGGVLLKEEWNGEDVIVELTWAAEKYQLERLTEFLDKALPEIELSGTDVLAKLALLTKRLGMENAEKELFAKLKEEAVDVDQLLVDKEGDLLGDN